MLEGADGFVPGLGDARQALWRQAAAASGFVMTAMYLVLALFPIIDVPKPLTFTAKMGELTLAWQFAAVLVLCLLSPVASSPRG